jgi:hypothetical protein
MFSMSGTILESKIKEPAATRAIANTDSAEMGQERALCDSQRQFCVSQHALHFWIMIHPRGEQMKRRRCGIETESKSVLEIYSQQCRIIVEDVENLLLQRPDTRLGEMLTSPKVADAMIVVDALIPCTIRCDRARRI